MFAVAAALRGLFSRSGRLGRAKMWPGRPSTGTCHLYDIIIIVIIIMASYVIYHIISGICHLYDIIIIMPYIITIIIIMSLAQDYAIDFSTVRVDTSTHPDVYTSKQYTYPHIRVHV